MASRILCCFGIWNQFASPAVLKFYPDLVYRKLLSNAKNISQLSNDYFSFTLMVKTQMQMICFLPELLLSDVMQLVVLSTSNLSINPLLAPFLDRDTPPTDYTTKLLYRILRLWIELNFVNQPVHSHYFFYNLCTKVYTLFS